MWFDVDFSLSKAGLSTVGYRQYNGSGGDAVSRTTSGVVEVGNGVYGVDVEPNASAVGIQWDTGEASPTYASESLTSPLNSQKAVDILEGDHIENSVSMVINKKGTANPVVSKTITGSLLPAGVQISTNEP